MFPLFERPFRKHLGHTTVCTNPQRKLLPFLICAMYSPYWSTFKRISYWAIGSHCTLKVVKIHKLPFVPFSNLTSVGPTRTAPVQYAELCCNHGIGSPLCFLTVCASTISSYDQSLFIRLLRFAQWAFATSSETSAVKLCSFWSLVCSPVHRNPILIKFGLKKNCWKYYFDQTSPICSAKIGEINFL